MAVLGASSLQINSATLGSQTGSAPMFAARAWVNFNGTGTPSIRANGNVSSVTRNSTGDYTVNFTTAMPDANYNFTGMAQSVGVFGVPTVCGSNSASPTTTTLRIVSDRGDNTIADIGTLCVSVFR